MELTDKIDYLLRLRLVVAWHGEMDRSGWWNTRVLSPRGGALLERGFPRTHPLVRARIAFRVATARCREALARNEALSLWSLPASLEDRFEERWSTWLDNGSEWKTFIERLDETGEEKLLPDLHAMDLITPEHATAIEALPPSRQERGRIRIAEKREEDEDSLALLAGGFAKGEKGQLVVPYIA